MSTETEENIRLKKENAELKRENAEVINSTNTSRIVLETVKKQEAEGLGVLKGLADEVEQSVKSARVVGEEAKKVATELVSLNVDRDLLIEEIETTKKAVSDAHKQVLAGFASETESIKKTLEVKQNELTEVLSKIKTQSFNLIELQAQIKQVSEDINSTQTRYDILSSEFEVKAGELELIESEVVTAGGNLEAVNHAVKVAEEALSSSEARQDSLLSTILELENTIEALKKEKDDINEEISDFRGVREEVEAQYKQSESKIFDLVRREEALAEREQYAKERFRVAGLEY